ncbi:MAG: SAP domain-containing protein [Phycisphaerae bacterium]
MADVRARAKTMGITTARKGKEDLIREIQRGEGNRDCYNRGESQTCGQVACTWRDGCK